LSGAAGLLKQIAREGETRLHTSPPSAADLAAGRTAVAINRTQGDDRRARLVRLVTQLRTEMKKLGLESRSELPIPIQVIAMPSLRAAKAALVSLHDSGIRALVTRSCLGDLPSLTLLITARHTLADISQVTKALAHATKVNSQTHRRSLEAA
jgi:8-amino-7-oxononanoate synthase